MQVDSRRVGYRINDLQGTPNEARQLVEVELLGGVANRIIAAKIVPRVIVDVVELIEKCTGRMLFASIADFLDDARQRVIRTEETGIGQSAVGLDYEMHLRDNVPRLAHSGFVKVQQVDDLRRHAVFASILKLKLYGFGSHLLHAGAVVRRILRAALR